MDILGWVKVLGAVSSFVAISKILYDIVSGKRAKLRDEYRFAKEFLNDTNGNLHPYAKEKGYQALAGTNTIPANEIEYILSLVNPAQCLRDYVLSRNYLEKTEVMGSAHLRFKKKYQSINKRRFLIVCYGLIYALCFMAMTCPIYLKSWFQLSNTDTLIALAITFTAFPYPTWWSLKEGVKIGRAQQLVKNQRLHSWELVTQT
ncbi:hypothetical protein WMQ46_22885 [Vibrio diabolicus]|uniref:hypothetical protein n=1 Tax=Vibrio diabolicus TaxID=50719 RepID=UPI00375329C4